MSFLRSISGIFAAGKRSSKKRMGPDDGGDEEITLVIPKAENAAKDSASSVSSSNGHNLPPRVRGSADGPRGSIDPAGARSRRSVPVEESLTQSVSAPIVGVARNAPPAAPNPRYSFAMSTPRASEAGIRASDIELVDAFGTDEAGNTGLHIAAFEGDIPGALKLLEAGAAVDAPNGALWTPLMAAAAGGTLEMVTLLLEVAANPLLANNEGNTALHEAALANNHATCALLSKHPCCDPNQPNLEGNTPLHLACMAGHLESSAAILGSGRACPFLVNLQDACPLQAAALEGHLKAVEFLVARGRMDPNVRNLEGQTMLHLAVLRASPAALIKAIGTSVPGINTNAQDKQGFTPLMRAIQRGDLALVRLVLSLPGVQVNLINTTPIPPAWRDAIEAASMTSTVPVNEKRRKSAAFRNIRAMRPNTTQNRRELGLCLDASSWSSALHLASALGHEDIVLELVEKAGADVELSDALLRTPLHSAVAAGQRRVVKYLIEQVGAEVEAREGVLGWSCLHVACFTANLEMASYLVLRAQARINSRARDGSTPFVLASEVREVLQAMREADKVPSPSGALDFGQLMGGPPAVMQRRASVEPGGTFIPGARRDNSGSLELRLPPVVVGREGHQGLPAIPGSPSTAGEGSTPLEFILPAPDKEVMKVLAVGGGKNYGDYRRVASETGVVCSPAPTLSIPAMGPEASDNGAAAAADTTRILLRAGPTPSVAPDGRGTKSCDAAVPSPSRTSANIPPLGALGIVVSGVGAGSSTLVQPLGKAEAAGPGPSPLQPKPTEQPPAPLKAASGPLSPLASATTPSALMVDHLPPNGSRGALDRILDLLREKGGKDVRPMDRDSLLRSAAEGHADRVRLLVLGYATSPNARDAQGRTPLHLAVLGGAEGHLEVLQALLQEPSVDADTADDEGKTPLALAQSLGRGEFARALLEAGAVDPAACGGGAAAAPPAPQDVVGALAEAAADAAAVVERERQSEVQGPVPEGLDL